MTISGRRITFYLAFLLIFIGLVFVFSIIKNATKPETTTPVSDLTSLLNEYKSLAMDSPQKAMTRLRQQSTKQAYILANCHRIAHEVGSASFNNTGDFKKALSTQDPFCNSGYLHGVIEAYFSSEPVTEEIIQKTCPVSVPFQYNDWQCAHGIGHGIMYTNHENLTESIRICQSLKTGDMTSACINGAYMEYFNEEGIENVSVQNPFEACETQKEEIALDCYLYAPTGILIQNGDDYMRVSELCSKRDEKYKSYCFQGIGSAVMKKHLDNPKIADEICEKTKDYENCIRGATTYAYFHFGSGRPVGMICLLLKDSGREICSQTRKNLSSNFGEAKAQ